MKNLISTFVLSLWLITSISYAQDITNTLAPNGSFKIKDSSTDFFILNQSNGTITLPLQLAGNQQGSIFKGINRFLHTYRGPWTTDGNTFLGIKAGNFTLGSAIPYEGSYNTGVGYESLTSLTTGYSNSAFGFWSLYYNTTGYFNSAFGHLSLYYNITGNSNSAFGTNSLHSNTTGNSNSAFGRNSLFSNTTGVFNSAFGSLSLALNTTGSQNSAFGGESLLSNTTGYNNSGYGSYSLNLNSTGYENSAFGSYSLYQNTTGSHNTAFGFDALRNNIEGFQNTAVGHHSLQNNTGNYNTAIGYNAGSTVTSGYNLTLVGIDANPSSPTANDQITLGNIFVSSLRCNVQTITSLSDARDKKNIKDLTLGLDFITKLKPRQFNWDKREWYGDNKSDGSKMQETPTAGFIAQELDEAQTKENAEWLNLVLKDNPDKWEATYGNLLPVMVKAIQELSIKNEELASAVDGLTIKNEELTIKNEQLSEGLLSEKIVKDEEIAVLKDKNSNLEERLAKFEEMQTVLVKELEQIKSNQQIFKVQIVNSENNNQ